ncbi:hypothetical protein [Streptomyces sp. NPDC050485]|uniref:hypothetical protein n=1 Tax=Streptomyces sp. NPDC050485 TaxID=3365617 RepID=UPI0037A44571
MGLRKFGTSVTIPANASATTGMLTRKTEPHQKWSFTPEQRAAIHDWLTGISEACR